MQKSIYGRILLIILGCVASCGGLWLIVYLHGNKYVTAQGCWRQAIYLQHITEDIGRYFPSTNSPPSWDQILAVEALKKEILVHPRLQDFVNNGYRDYYGNPFILTNLNKGNSHWQILISRQSYERVRKDTGWTDSFLHSLTPVDTP